MHDFWARNLRIALIAKELDALWKCNQTDTAFLCGLVHHIGQLVMYRRIPVLAREVELLMQVHGPNEVDESTIQREVIGFDHFEVGAALARLWNLPAVVTQSIELHHAPDSNPAYEGIATLVRIACHLGQLNLPPYPTITHPEFALTADEASAILEKTHQDFEAIFKFFYPTV